MIEWMVRKNLKAKVYLLKKKEMLGHDSTHLLKVMLNNSEVEGQRWKCKKKFQLRIINGAITHFCQLT